MSQNIILTSENLTNKDRGNNRLEYIFPQDVTFEKGDKVALSTINLYYSWFNISEKTYGNNFFQYKWFNNVDGQVTDIFDVVVPDGYYTIDTLYEYFQTVMVANGHYLELISGGTFMYFIEIKVNSTYYASSVRLSTVSTTYNFGNGNVAITDQVKVPSTWVIPDGIFVAPELIIPSNNNFGKLLGFQSGQTLQVPAGTSTQLTHSHLSTTAPNMNPSSSFIVTCSLVDNPLAVPNNIIFSFSLGSEPFGGSVIPFNSTEMLYSYIKPGKYRSVVLQIYDQEFRPLQIRDPTMLMNLSFILAPREE